MSGWEDQGPATLGDGTDHPVYNPQAEALYNSMQSQGLNVRDMAKQFGVSQQDMSNFLNTGRKREVISIGHGDGGNENLGNWNFDLQRPMGMSRPDFDAQVAKHPELLDANGRFVSPNQGGSYRWEGMTPDQVFAASNAPKETSQDDDPNYGNYGNHEALERPDNIYTVWEPGPDMGGGWLGWGARAVGGWGTGLSKVLPAVMGVLGAASAAGEAGSVASETGEAGSAVNEAASTAEAAGGSGTNAALYSNAGYGTSTAPSLSQQVVNFLNKPGVIQAGRGFSNGGGIVGAARGYLGGQVGGIIDNAATKATDSEGIGNAAGQFSSAVFSGQDPLKALTSSGVGAATGMITSNIPGFSTLSPIDQQAINGLVSSTLISGNPSSALISTAQSIANNEVSRRVKSGGK